MAAVLRRRGCGAPRRPLWRVVRGGLAPEDQAAVTDLAMMYSTAVNKSIGGIKEAAENRVEKMMEGKPPQLFDTAGVLSDYATNNLKDRSLQSSDQPETQS